MGQRHLLDTVESKLENCVDKNVKTIDSFSENFFATTFLILSQNNELNKNHTKVFSLPYRRLSNNFFSRAVFDFL